MPTERTEAVVVVMAVEVVVTEMLLTLAKVVKILRIPTKVERKTRVPHVPCSDCGNGVRRFRRLRLRLRLRRWPFEYRLDIHNQCARCRMRRRSSLFRVSSTQERPVRSYTKDEGCARQHLGYRGAFSFSIACTKCRLCRRQTRLTWNAMSTRHLVCIVVVGRLG